MGALFLRLSCWWLLLAAWPLAAGNHYRIEATLDPERNQVQGTVRMSFRNPLKGPLGDIPVHTIAQISRVTDGAGRELRFQRNYLLAGDAIVLPQPLAPGGSIELETAFTVSAPAHRDGYRLLTGAWHPKAVVFRDGRFQQQEKQADSYEVTLTAPAAEVVVTSGKLAAEETLPEGMKRRRYRAEDITNFGVASSPQFLQVSRQAGEVPIHSYYLPGGEKWGVRLADYASRIVTFYRGLFGFYPQDVVSILPGSKTSGGGYPAASNLFVVHDTLDRQGGEPFAEWIMAHEIGHQYWGFDCVIDSGAYYHWPGLALGIYTDRLYSESRGLPAGRDYRGFVSRYMSGVEAGHDTTIRRTWREIEKLSFDFNNVVAHGKAYAVIQMLEEVIGKDTFFALVKTVLARYRNRYLSFEDFERVTEEISGQKLGWFFRDWVDGNKTLSYAVEAVEQTGGEARVTVRRTGTAGMPLELELVLADGTRQRRRIARETELQTITFPAKARVRQARLDPDQRMALYSPGGEHVWNIPLDPQFRQRAMAHVEHLAGLGQRVAGTEGETEAIQYIRAEMEKAGLRVAVEPFTFQSYRLDKAVLRMAEDAAEAAELGFDPYGPAGIQGEAVFLDPAVVNDPRQLSKAGIDGKIVVTTRGARLFLVGYLAKPKAAASVAPEDFERLKGRSGGPVELTTEGRRTEVRTANVVGTLGADSAAREVILSAHHDSWKGPGASDNASGVAVLLELARYFAQRKEPLPFRLRFVTFGAEEAGMLGAKAYLRQHEAELEDCELLFNMDTLGGKNFYVEMRGGVKGLPPKKGQNQLPADLMDKATHDLNARWFLLRPNVDLDASNVPEWLQQSIRETAEELGLAIRPAQQMGSDHRIFAQAGIVATNVAATVGKTHTAEDVPANLSAENLERVARLVAGVVEKVR